MRSDLSGEFTIHLDFDAGPFEVTNETTSLTVPAPTSSAATEEAKSQ